MRDQQERDDRRRNVKGGAELAGQKSGGVGLVERVQQIGAAPDIEVPNERNAQAGSSAASETNARMAATMSP